MLIRDNVLSRITSIFLGLVLFVGAIKAQQHGAVPEFSPTNSEAVQITLHKATLNADNKANWESDYKVTAGNALSVSDINAGFKSTEKVIIRVKSPYPYYIYIVNFSDLDGTKLVQPFSNKSPNVEYPANQTKDFLFNFTKSDKVKKSREDFLILVSKTKIEISDNIINSGGNLGISLQREEEGKKLLDKLLLNSSKSETTATPANSTPTDTKTKTWVKVYSFGCNIASIFLPFLSNVCPKVSLGANPEFNNNQLSVSPTQNKDQLTFVISFTVEQ